MEGERDRDGQRQIRKGGFELVARSQGAADRKQTSQDCPDKRLDRA